MICHCLNNSMMEGTMGGMEGRMHKGQDGRNDGWEGTVDGWDGGGIDDKVERVVGKYVALHKQTL